MSSQLPFTNQFVVSLVAGTPLTVPARTFLSDGANARLYFSSYQLQLASFATSDVDVLTAKKLGRVQVRWGEATVLMPLSPHVAEASATQLTLSLSHLSANQDLHLELEGFTGGATAEILFNLTGL
jgi:hypothetical protein